MSISQLQKKEIIKRFGSNENDTGTTEVQIALLTAEIKALTVHMVNNKKDMISKRGLYTKVSKRRNLLSYLQKNDIERYRKIIKELELRN